MQTLRKAIYGKPAATYFLQQISIKLAANEVALGPLGAQRPCQVEAAHYVPGADTDRRISAKGNLARLHRLSSKKAIKEVVIPKNSDDCISARQWLNGS
jgi:hypothetical protein